jgi:hypothetical protein
MEIIAELPRNPFRKVPFLQPELRAAHCIKMCHSSTSVNIQSDSMPRVNFFKAHGVDLQLELKTKLVISQPQQVNLSSSKTCEPVHLKVLISISIPTQSTSSVTVVSGRSNVVKGPKLTNQIVRAGRS